MIHNLKFPVKLKLIDAKGFLEHCQKHSQKSYELGKIIAEKGEVTLYGVYQSIHGTPVLDTRIHSGFTTTIGLMFDELKFFNEVKDED